MVIHIRNTTLCRTPLDEGSARRRDLYLTTQNIHKRETSMPPAGFEPTNPASERPQTHALDRTVTGIGIFYGIASYNVEEPIVIRVVNSRKMGWSGHVARVGDKRNA
jgi:hypothetical protein